MEGSYGDSSLKLEDLDTHMINFYSKANLVHDHSRANAITNININTGSGISKTLSLKDAANKAPSKLIKSSVSAAKNMSIQPINGDRG